MLCAWCALFIILTLAIIMGESGDMGDMGRAFALLNLSWFGYVGYVYLLGLLYPAYALYKDSSLTPRRVVIMIATLLLAVGVLLIQALWLERGLAGEKLYDVMLPYIGAFGVWLVIILCVYVGVLLLYPAKIVAIQRMIAHESMCLARYMARNINEAYDYLAPFIARIIKKCYKVSATWLERVFASPTITQFDRAAIKDMPPSTQASAHNDASTKDNASSALEATPHLATTSMQTSKQSIASNDSSTHSPIYDSSTHDNLRQDSKHLRAMWGGEATFGRKEEEFDEGGVVILYHNEEKERIAKEQEERRHKTLVRLVPASEADKGGEVLEVNVEQAILRMKSSAQEVPSQTQSYYTKIITPSTINKPSSTDASSLASNNSEPYNRTQPYTHSASTTKPNMQHLTISHTKILHTSSLDKTHDNTQYASQSNPNDATQPSAHISQSKSPKALDNPSSIQKHALHEDLSLQQQDYHAMHDAHISSHDTSALNSDFNAPYNAPSSAPHEASHAPNEASHTQARISSPLHKDISISSTPIDSIPPLDAPSSTLLDDASSISDVADAALSNDTPQPSTPDMPLLIATNPTIADMPPSTATITPPQPLAHTPTATNPNDISAHSIKTHVSIARSVDMSKELLETLDKGELARPHNYTLPPTSLLQLPETERISFEEGEIDQKIQHLLTKLKVFKIDGDVSRIYSGPVVTTFEFRPAPNVKVSRIQSLSDDLAMALSARSIRIQAPIPGKDVVGIEVPNSHKEMIYLREILESEVFASSSSPLALGIGKDIVGNPFVTDLQKLPHLLIAGTTGSGKSVGLNAMILSLLYRNSPDSLRLIMIDPKKVEFSLYEEIPHLLTPIITDAKKAIIALNNVAKEMERRYEVMKALKTKTIDGYNAKIASEQGEILPFIVVIIDELADLMMTGGKEAEGSIIRIAQMGRAAGLHLIVATQRPSVDVVTGLIKTNLPAKIAYKVGSRMDSRVILDTEGAQNLLGQGDMLFSLGGGGSILRLHAPWASEGEIESIVSYIQAQREVQYDSSFLADSQALRVESDTQSFSDDLLSEAKKLMLMDGKTSISNLQRRLGVGYNKAASLVEELERQGFLSAPNTKGVREIIG